METHRKGEEVAKAFLDRKIMIGRVWPRMAHACAVTVGTQEEMDKFNAAVAEILA